jgi:hypothetical protein
MTTSKYVLKLALLTFSKNFKGLTIIINVVYMVISDLHSNFSTAKVQEEGK